MICDSAPEVFTVALRTYAELTPESPLAVLARRLGGPGAPSPPQITAATVYAEFVDLIPLGNRAEDFGVALTALDTGKQVASQASYDALRSEQSPDWLAAYHERFYQIRRALADDDPSGWMRLMRPYDAFLDLLRRRRADTGLAIVTAKDRWSVRVLLESFGAADLFPEDRVLDKETGVKKSAHLEHLQRSHGVAFADITFVDDKVNHLDEVARLGVRCALACWGYNGEREEELARRRGYVVCSLQDAEARLFD